jgi:hypothetical protein
VKVRTEALLYDAVDGDLIWRKKELTQLKFLLENSSARQDQRAALLRSSVPLLYAHWEGFIKSAGRAYLEYIASQRLRYDQLAPPILALAARRVLSQASASKRIRAHIDVTEFFRGALDAESDIPYKDGITTKANLSSEVLREIMLTLGLDFQPFETKAVLIDESLLAARNTIAHGEYLQIDEARYSELTHEVLTMMEWFRTQVENAAVLKQFKAA